MQRAAPEPQIHRVEAPDAGSRVDRFLASRLGVSRAETRRLLERGAISLDGRLLGLRDKGLVLVQGGRFEVVAFRPSHEQQATPSPDASLDVLASGPGWLAVDKPAGWPVHPLREEETGCVLNAVVARHPEVQGVGEAGLRSGVVHRLDLDTSGVLLVATDESVWQRLRAAFRERQVEKVYRAVVHGRIERELDLEFGLVVSRHRPARVRVVEIGPDMPAGGREAQQRLIPLEDFGGCSLVEVRPRTGFLHQIRATLAHIGHPVIGDRTYGSADRGPAPVSRHMLHAASVVYQEVRAQSPDPEDFRTALARLRS